MARRALTLISILCGATVPIDFASSQSAPEVKALDGASVFKQQCAVCHTVNLTDAQRQGPTLAKVIGRKAGSVEGFKYSAGLAAADFAWDDAKLDTWLTNPQAMIPGTIMVYRQGKPEVRAAVVGYLKGLN